MENYNNFKYDANMTVSRSALNNYLEKAISNTQTYTYKVNNINNLLSYEITVEINGVETEMLIFLDFLNKKVYSFDGTRVDESLENEVFKFYLNARNAIFADVSNSCSSYLEEIQTLENTTI